MTASRIASVRLYLYDGGSDYTDMGDHGVAIVATAGTPPEFRIGCYQGETYACTAEITPSNDTGLNLALQGQGYVSFRDDQGRLWSMHFENDEEAINLAAQVTCAMYGASNMPDNRIVCCDVATGKRDRLIYPGDRVKVRYQSWVVSRHGGMVELGSQLEGNMHEEKPYVFDVPANHNSVNREMYGFEGMVVGMAEESRRFIVIPEAAKRGRGHKVHAVHMVYVIKKKDGNFDDEGHGARASQGRSHNDNSSFDKQQTNAHNQQPTAPVQGGSGYNPYGAPNAQPQPHYFNPNAGMVTSYAPPAAAAVVALPVDPTPAYVPPQRAAAVIEQPPEALPKPPPAGFSLEQMETLERLRDQVGTLMAAIRDCTGNVDMFAHDFKQHDRKTKPPTLIAAQMDHSLRTLIEQTDELKAELAKRDEALNNLEERNRQLQAKADRFAKTAEQLTQERKATIANSSETKVDLDQQMLSLQARLTRVLADREDVGRHLTTVKRLLEISDKDTRDAKQQLQVAEVQLATNEAKLAQTDEAVQEERARRKLLEAKVVTLGDEVRSIMDEFRTKDGQVDDRRRQMQAAKLHFQQLMDDERAQAASELRQLRQELVDELAIRDQRYQAERVRVAKEAYERGRHQGIEDGEKAELLEGDMKMQTLQFDSQRHRSELETVKVRLRQVHEQAASDRRRLEAQIAALSRIVDDLGAQNQTMETELHSLEAAKDTVAAAAYDEAKAVLMQLTRPIGKKDLLNLIHQMRVKHEPQFGFEAVRADDEAAALVHEKREVEDWVRRFVSPNGNPHEAPPPMRLLAPQDPPLREPPADVMITDPDPAEPNTDPSRIATLAEWAPPSVDMAEVERRQKELLAQLHANNPSLELAPPPREPTPTPPRTPTPEAEPEPEPELEPEPAAAESSPQAHNDDEPADAARDAESDGEGAAPAPAGAHADGDHDDTQHDQTAETAAQENVDAPEEPATAGAAPHSGASDDEAAPVAAARPPPAAPRPAADDHDDTSAEPTPRPAPAAARPAAKGPAAAPPAATFLDTDDDSSAFFRPSAPVAKAPAAKASAAPTAKPAAKPAARHNALFADSEEEDEPAPRGTAAAAPAVAPAAAKRAPPSAGVFGGKAASDSDDDAAGSSVPTRSAPLAAAGKGKAAPAAKPAAKTGLFFAGSDDDDDDDGPLIAPPSKARPTAAAAPSKKPAPKPKFGGGLFADSEDED